MLIDSPQLASRPGRPPSGTNARNQPRTFGVEEELLIVDADTLRPVPRGDDMVMAATPPPRAIGSRPNSNENGRR